MPRDEPSPNFNLPVHPCLRPLRLGMAGHGARPHPFKNMKRFHPPASVLLLVTACLLAIPAITRGAEETPSTLAFSDPTKPGILKVQVGRGDLRIQGTDTTEVVVKSEAKAANKAPRQDGLRVLTAASSFSLTETDNVITLDALGEGWAGSSADFRITVPRTTSIIVQNSWGGDVTCTGLSGDIEINSMNGQIRLDDVSGGIVVSTMNGEIRATIRELQDKKPLSFTSMNGEVQLRIPAQAKANVRLRTQNGSVLTDFEETALVTKTESVSRPDSRAAVRAPRPPSKNESDVGEAVREAMQEAAQAVREGAAVAREALRAAADEFRAHSNSDKPRPPRPPLPVTPTPTGGKLVTGSLNGGGPEISIATMNGDVILRKRDDRK